jgi:hypothetical protein
MNNQDTINEIREKTETILNKVENETLQEDFKLGDISITNESIYLNSKELEGRAKRKILNILRVKKNFSEYAKTMSESDWRSVSHKLKSTEGDTPLIAQYNDKGEIVNILSKNVNKKKPDNLKLRSYVDMTCEALAETENEYRLDDLVFLPENHRFDVTLLNPSIDIDIFQNGKDIWHGGQSLTFNEVGFRTNPFFERLVCSNGMRAKDFGFVASVHQSKFNVAKIADEIRKAINIDGQKYMDMIITASNHLSKNNASIAEFERFKNFFFKKMEDNPSYYKIIDKFFNDQPFYKSYGVNIAEKSNKWKSTANSGINSYDLFNMLTWIASHEKESGISSKDGIELQLAASNYLFKKEMDLEDIANQIKVDYPKILEMV